LSACIRRGLCVEACPYDTLSLAEWGDEAAVGTPPLHPAPDPVLHVPRRACARACPTGALDREIPDIRQADMGVAVLVGHETCLNHKGLNCSICHRVCPCATRRLRWKRARSTAAPWSCPWSMPTNAPAAGP